MKTYDPAVKRNALILWAIFSVVWLAAMASPLYFLRHTLAARPEFLVLLSLLFLWVAWTWFKLASAVGRRIKDLPVEPSP